MIFLFTKKLIYNIIIIVKEYDYEENINTIINNNYLILSFTSICYLSISIRIKIRYKY